jgi:hypothetical protein
MERRADRELPSVTTSRFRWYLTLPIFGAIMLVSTLAIFNYQKTSSSVVSSTLYSLRTNAKAREILGDEIYFASKIPWISGELNQLHGRIDISFWVKGTRGKGLMRFKSVRRTRMGYVSTSPRSKEGCMEMVCADFPYSLRLLSGVWSLKEERRSRCFRAKMEIRSSSRRLLRRWLPLRRGIVSTCYAFRPCSTGSVSLIRANGTPTKPGLLWKQNRDSATAGPAIRTHSTLL